MAHKLAECLLRRKELQQKLDRMNQIDSKDLFEIKAARKKVTDDIDDVVAQVPKMTYSQFEAEYRHYAKALRLIDGAIQQVNWTATVDGVGDCFRDFDPDIE
ncbi:MAG: hypothetical protein GWN00_23980 [Aliifodinibius sp.]|nr:hypothetical protein [Fodinibius sp.]NIY27751.1 hypothetical protein [Fodinibius sp.]